MENPIVLNGIYLKIYTEDNGATLVFEGQGTEDKNGVYYPARCNETECRIGTVVIGRDHIVITHDAANAFERILREARHTTNDIGDIAISRIGVNEVCVSYIGDVVRKINIEEAINSDTFFIGCGEDKLDPSMVYELRCINQFKTNRALDFVLDYWKKKFIDNREDITEAQAKMFMDILRNNLGYPVRVQGELNGGSIGGYDTVNCNVVADALKLAGIEYNQSEEMTVRIIQWFTENHKRSIAVHTPGKLTYITDIVEEC